MLFRPDLIHGPVQRLMVCVALSVPWRMGPVHIHEEIGRQVHRGKEVCAAMVFAPVREILENLPDALVSVSMAHRTPCAMA
jgi:hypothetical protein